jgi:predicted dehydrogenase
MGIALGAGSKVSVVRVAIIGCGAVTEQLHIPPLLARDDCRVTVLVDRDPRRLDAVGRLVPDAKRAESYAAAIDDFDAAIIALPHNLHAPVAGELLRAGKSILVEKPMALSTTDCDAMIAAATKPWSLTIGQMRRFCPAVAMARRLLESELIGTVQSVDVRDGVVFGWPLESDFQFRKEKAGGGVLVDTGAHALDMIIGWFGEPEAVSYADDTRGGVEADCVVELKLPGSVPCRVELSRTRNLRNSAVIRGTKGALDVAFYDNKLTMLLDASPAFQCMPAGPPGDIWREMFDLQLENWLDSIQTMHSPAVPGSEGRKVVALIENLYAIRTPLELHWERFDTAGVLATI